MKQIRIACKGHIELDISELNEFQGDLKSLSKTRFEQLKKSILELGFSFPENVWKNPSDNKWYICDGTQRFRTIKQMVSKEGYNCPKLPCSIVEAKDRKQAKLKLLAAASQYGQVEGQGLYEFITEAGISFPELSENFNFPEIQMPEFELEFFHDDPESIEGEDEVPEALENTNIKLGDLFILGEHRLLCGDSTDIGQVDKLMNGQKADMVFTDPPYGINIVKPGGIVGVPSQLEARKYKEIIGDNTPFDPNFILNLDIKIIILWGANHYASKLPDKPQWLIWDKKIESGKLDHNKFSDCELAWTNSSALSAKIYRHTWAGMIREGDKHEELSERVHPTQKPVGLCSDIIEDFSKQDMALLDLFGGSGSTLIACEKTNRKCFMMEIDPSYCQVILDRWAKFTGKDPVREDGVKWSELK